MFFALDRAGRHEVGAVVALRAAAVGDRRDALGGDVLAVARGAGGILCLRAKFIRRPPGIGHRVGHVEIEVPVAGNARLVNEGEILCAQDLAGLVRVGLDHRGLRVARRAVVGDVRVPLRDRPGVHEFLGAVEIIIRRHAGRADEQRQRADEKPQRPEIMRPVVVIEVALQPLGHLLLCALVQGHGIRAEC